MPIQITLSTTLREVIPNYDPLKGVTIELPIDRPLLPKCDHPYPQHLLVRDVAVHLGLPLDEIKIIMKNNRHASLTDAVEDGDRLAYFPAVGGG